MIHCIIHYYRLISMTSAYIMYLNICYRQSISRYYGVRLAFCSTQHLSYPIYSHLYRLVKNILLNVLQSFYKSNHTSHKHNVIWLKINLCNDRLKYGVTMFTSENTLTVLLKLFDQIRLNVTKSSSKIYHVI